MLIIKSEDLPIVGTKDHEELVEYRLSGFFYIEDETNSSLTMSFCIGRRTFSCAGMHGKEIMMNEPKNKRFPKKLLIGGAALVVLIAVFVLAYIQFSPKPQAGAKTVTIEVIDDRSGSNIYTTHTDAEYLQQVMEETENLTFSGVESEYGLMINTINGLRADYVLDSAYWGVFVNGDYCNYGISEQPVYDGDTFQIIYTPAE